MKIVIIGGIGHIGYALEGIRRNPELLQFCGFASVVPDDMPAPTVQLMTSEFDAAFFSDWRKMLDVVKPDVAVVATRFDLNGTISLECLKRGINCFTEKTIAHSFEMLERLETAAIENDCRIIGMHDMRYKPEFFAAYEAVREGAIGDMVMLYGRKSYRFGTARPEFYRCRSTYGGTILWVAVHALDWFCWLAGPASRVFAAHTVKGLNYGECESAAVISLCFDNGIIGTISADFLRSQNAPSHSDDQLRIAGSRGIIEVKHGKAILTNETTPPRELELKPQGDFFGDYCRSIQGNGLCRLDMADTFLVSRLALCARESADTQTLYS